MNQAQMMDRIYRYQRHIYDESRRFFLLGRDTLIKIMEVGNEDKILEIACGTARNLIILSRLYPKTQLYGIDASLQMLESAEAKIRKAKLTNRIVLKQCLAEELDHGSIFGLDEAFDLIFLSYSLSMISNCIKAFDVALRNLRSGQTIYIVDFWDQRDFPLWFRKIFKKWLRIFHVEYKAELLDYLYTLDNRGLGELRFSPIYKSYSFLSTFRNF
jgi:S-adenosylmethionine-diacylgycerolhomoserine-N-methlytransferase